MGFYHLLPIKLVFLIVYLSSPFDKVQRWQFCALSERGIAAQNSLHIAPTCRRMRIYAYSAKERHQKITEEYSKEIVLQLHFVRFTFFMLSADFCPPFCSKLIA